MSRRRLALLLLVPSSLTVGACDFFYIVQARVPLATPVSQDCLQSIPDAPRALRLAAITFRPSPGISRIYAYLPGFALKDAIAGVAVDGQLVGQLDGGSYLMVELPPGHHRITAITSHYANSVALDVSPDSSAFVQLHWKKMSWTRQADFVTPDAARIRDAIRAAHMVTSSWPGTPMP